MAATKPSNSTSSTPIIFPVSPQPHAGQLSTPEKDHHRNLADFPLSKWTTYFTNISINDIDLSNQWLQIEELKAKLRIKLNLLSNEPLRKLKMIDAVQQLGLTYQFQEEIDHAMRILFETDVVTTTTDDYDLYHTSLYFRLLRQHGYNVSSSLFEKFIDDTSDNRDLKEGYQSDVIGMVEFYEAVQLRVNEDATILDEDFLDRCITRLKSIADNYLSPQIKTQVTDALKQSIHKDIPWFRARKFIDTYQEDESHDATLLCLAKLHFNVLQKHHQQELCDFSKEWNALGIGSKFPYARERLVGSYIWAIAVYYEPQYSVGRKIVTKFVALIAIVDDTYDAYGTADELQILTQALTSGNTSMFSQLPAFGRDLCQVYLDFYGEIEQDMAAEGRSFAVDYAIKWLKFISKFYYDEYLWLKNKQHVPTMEEYRRVAFASSNMACGSVITMLGLSNDDLTKAVLDWVSSQPNMVLACLLIARFQDDIVTHEFEQGREHVPSAVHCYMNEYGVGKEEACKELTKEITNGWKILNEGCMKPTTFPFPVHERILNFTRIIDVLYKDDDNYTHPVKFLDAKITWLFVRPVE